MSHRSLNFIERQNREKRENGSLSKNVDFRVFENFYKYMYSFTFFYDKFKGNGNQKLE